MDQSLPQQTPQPSANAEDSNPNGGANAQSGKVPSPDIEVSPPANIPQPEKSPNPNAGGQTAVVPPQDGIPAAVPSAVPPLPQAQPVPAIFDVIIIGGGPAGLSASIYAVRKNLKVLLITKDIGGQAAISGNIENYLGFALITGPELAMKFREDVERFKNEGIWIVEKTTVTKISGSYPSFKVLADNKREYSSRTVIIASGRLPKMLGVPGEREFLGKGVATCATCDAPLFKGKDVVVVGSGNSALDAAFSLMKMAKSVTLVVTADGLHGDSILMDNVVNAPNVKIMKGYQVLEIKAEHFVNGIKLRENASGQELVLPVTGVFVEIGWEPSIPFDELTRKNDRGEIMVDDYGSTSVTGIWAAGDVNSLSGEQIVISAGEGARAAIACANFLSKMPVG